MKPINFLAAAIVLALGSATAQAQSNADKARNLVERVTADTRANYVETVAAQWIAATYINDDTQVLSSKASERALGRLKGFIDEARALDMKGVDAEMARALQLLKLQTSMPAPKDPAKLAELTRLQAKLEATYGSGKYCRENGECWDIGKITDILNESRDPALLREAWEGWHSIARPMRADYQRFAEIINEGARELGYADAGEYWRASYDMSPAQFRDDTARLWSQVEPLYKELHCHVRNKLNAHYGDAVVPKEGPIPAHLLGNLWAQDWMGVYDLVEPYKGVSNLDVTGGLVREGYDAKKMVQRAEDFYVSLGMPKLPESFYSKSQLVQPRDRDVVCHASAWDMNLAGDVRIKMCIKPNEEEFRTIYHELGHIYYYLAYNDLLPLFQSGAHDGFHEAIGDTVLLSLTPGYMHSIGLVGEAGASQEAVINNQMKLALEKIVFLPFGKLIDEWRWGVFDGSIKPDQYNAGWWDLKNRYQGVAPPSARGESEFDPGAKYHVPGNTPYTRYFLAHILQFQFHRSLCEVAGHTGPLHECSIYGNKAAGERFWAMLEKGQSQPWQKTLKELTGKEEADATAIIDYFAPLMSYLKEQNKGQSCGW